MGCGSSKSQNSKGQTGKGGKSSKENKKEAPSKKEGAHPEKAAGGHAGAKEKKTEGVSYGLGQLVRPLQQDKSKHN